MSNTTNLSRRKLFFGVILSAIFALQIFAQNAPPKAEVRNVTDEYFGQKITDPYRWMEESNSAELAAYLKAQNDYTRRMLGAIPERAALLKRITELSDASVALHTITRAGGKYFYYKIAPGDDNQKLYVRDSLNGAERLLIDPEKLTKDGKHFSIDYFSPSDDGKYVAYGLSPSGSENSVLYVLETATGKDMGERIDRARFASPSWRTDNRSFFYNRMQKLEAGMPPVEIYKKSKVYVHTLGSDPDKDTAVFGYGVAPGTEVGESDFSFVNAPVDSKYVFGTIEHGVLNEATVYVAPLAAVDGAKTPWRKLVDVPDAVTSFSVRGDDVYLLTHKDASRFKVIKVNVSKPESKAETVLPAAQAVVTGLGVAKDALYVQLLDGGISRVQRITFDGKPARQIKLPFDGFIGEMVTDPRISGALIKMGGWTKPNLWYSYDPATDTLTDTKLRPLSPVDFSNIETVEVKAKSYDGTLVPLSIIYRKDIKRDGTNPTLLIGYGSYGISITPGFGPTSLAWLERGGIYAVAHVRGGGEYGEDWHSGGQKATKMNTIKDFIACAEYLINEKYTSPTHLAGQGGSAGGILIGGAITQRPDLFAAAISNVGVADNLRIELTPNGPPNVPEFGSVKTKEGFDALYAMSSYHHVKDGTKYPAVLLTTGVNDPRVDSWQAAKMTARLQAASTGGKPILLRVDYDAGHGIGSTKSQRNEEEADTYAFLFQQLGGTKIR